MMTTPTTVRESGPAGRRLCCNRCASFGEAGGQCAQAAARTRLVGADARDGRTGGRAHAGPDLGGTGGRREPGAGSRQRAAGGEGPASQPASQTDASGTAARLFVETGARHLQRHVRRRERQHARPECGAACGGVGAAAEAERVLLNNINNITNYMYSMTDLYIFRTFCLGARGEGPRRGPGRRLGRRPEARAGRAGGQAWRA